jgi:hypothetical protein
MTDKTTDGLRAKVQKLMTYGVSANIAELDKIYHEDLEVITLTIDGQYMSLPKQGVLELLTETFKDKIPQAHMWAHIHSAKVTGARGHVLISRKLPMGGPKMHFDLSIDFIFEDDRWQVTREVNFVRPDVDAA